MGRSETQAHLRDAIAQAQAGQRTEARRMLREIVEADPTQALAWMWLATVSTDRAERIEYLERALALNPANNTAREAYTQLTGTPYEPPETPPVAPSAGPASGLSRRARLTILVAGLLLLIGVGAIMVLRNSGDDGPRTPRRSPTPTALPTAIPTITPTRYHSPTPSRTPGPSPTPFTPPPTWTPPPTQTPRPTFTAAPTSTAFPTPVPFIAPWAKSATAAFAQTSDAPRTATPQASD
jgi:tetratricopeptide (TPR) repeat protein